MTRALIGPAFLLLLACGRPALATDSADRNPFARPARVSAPAAPGEVPARSAPAFTLRATMAAGPDSLVNIDGRIVAVGDLYAGFRLVAVGEGTAVFVKDGVRFPMTVTHRDGDQ